MKLVAWPQSGKLYYIKEWTSDDYIKEEKIYYTDVELWDAEFNCTTKMQLNEVVMYIDTTERYEIQYHKLLYKGQIVYINIPNTEFFER